MPMKRLVSVIFLCIGWVMFSGCQSKAAKNLDALIMAIGDVDTTSGPVVAYVRDQYEVLADADKSKLQKYDVLLSAEAAYVDALINSIGEVTADSSDAIAAAEAAFANLDQEAQRLVTGSQTLRNARPECDEKILIRRLSGLWVNEVLGNRSNQIGRGLIHSYGLDETNCDPVKVEDCQFELQEDGTVRVGAEQTGSWILSEDQSSVAITVDGAVSELNLIEEGGFLKLVGSLLDNAPFGYVRDADYVSAFHEKYAVVGLNREDVELYFADPVLIGGAETLQGKMHNAYWYESKAYADGLVYFGSSCVIPVIYDHGGKWYNLWLEFPVLSTTELKIKEIHINTDARISGEVFYVKAPYVSKNYINEDGYRVVELTNGISMVFDGYDEMMNTFWHRCEAAYEEHIY